MHIILGLLESSLIFWPFEKLTFKRSLFRHTYFKCTSVLLACMLCPICMPGVQGGQKEGTRSFGTRVTSCELSCVFWELNPGLLYEQQVLLTTPGKRCQLVPLLDHTVKMVLLSPYCTGHVFLITTKSMANAWETGHLPCAHALVFP